MEDTIFDYIPEEIVCYPGSELEIPPFFKTLQEKSQFKSLLEKIKGQGAGRAFDYPVDLEPPFQYYDHLNLSDMDLHFIGESHYSPPPYPDYPLTHIRALLKDELQPRHLLSMLVSLTGDQHISFEIIVDKEIKLYFTLPEQLKDTLLSQLYTFFPNSQFGIEKKDPVLAELIYPLEYALENWAIFPLKTINDPNALTYLIGLLEELEGFGVIQIFVKRCTGTWEYNLDVCLRERYRYERIQYRDLDIESVLKEKIKPPFFAVAIRTGYSNKETCRRLHRFLTVFNNTHQKLVPLIPVQQFEWSYFDRTAHRYGMLLSAEETVNLVYLPIQVEGSIRFKKVDFIQLPSQEYPEGILIGINRFRNRETPIRINENLLCRHMLIAGATGTGKSTLIRNMARSAIEEGLGIAVFDIKGDLAESILQLIPAERVKDTYYVNAQDRENPVALNILKFKDFRPHYDLVQDIISVIDKTTGGRSDPLTARMIRYLRMAMLTVLRLPDTTLFDVSKFLSSTNTRWEIINKVNDGELTDFWYNFEAESKSNRLAFDVSIDGIINRLDQFVSDDIVGNMVKQKELALDFPGITHDNKILIVNLANIGENRVSTLGTLLLTELMLAGVKKPLESGHPFIIFADEFSFYHTPTLTQVLRLGRAYKMSLVLSHQNVEDLPQELAAGVFGNVAAMVAFRVGSTYAAKLSSNFGQEVEDNNFITIPLYKTYTKIETNIFTMDTLPPPTENMGQSALIIENSKKLCSGIPKTDDKKVEKGIPIGATLGFNEWYKVKWVAPLRDDPPDDLTKTG